MTIAHAYILLLEAVALAASFGIVWLSFWMRDRRRPYREVQSGEWSRQSLFNRASEQQDNGARRAIDLASSDVQPVSEKHEAILYRPEHAQYLNDKPEIQAEQEQRA
jgi:hypothetical protein